VFQRSGLPSSTYAARSVDQPTTPTPCFCVTDATQDIT
jgi:hypothetical protein